LIVAFHKFVPLLATPAAQMRREIRSRGANAESAADGQVAQRPFKKQMRAGRERERLNPEEGRFIVPGPHTQVCPYVYPPRLTERGLLWTD
jgi:hypothetical protein